MKAPIAVIILVSFVMTGIIGPVPVCAQADEFHLPVPGVMVHLSPPLDPPILKGIKVHPDNPFRFEFILDQGDSSVIASAAKQSFIKEESTRLIKYFLASLTIPEKDLWVNLSPYEKDRIIPQSFGLTEMGRDLLAEDYMLKQITASLIYPEGEIGKKFWKRIYEEAAKKFGTTNIPVNTFNKVWIVPDKAVVYENAKAGTAYVVESKLKVMLEQDYLSLNRHSERSEESKGVNALGAQIVREIVIPELTQEVNENKNFARLRQVYNSLILATWYKKKIKDSILDQVYADKNKTAGVQYTSTVIPAKAGIHFKNDVEGLYQEYLKAFKKGVYNYIKEDIDPLTQETIPRKYFSGGVILGLTVTRLGAMGTIRFTRQIPGSAMISRDRAQVINVVFNVSNRAMSSHILTRRKFSKMAVGLMALMTGNDPVWRDFHDKWGVGAERVRRVFAPSELSRALRDRSSVEMSALNIDLLASRMGSMNERNFELFYKTLGFGQRPALLTEFEPTYTKKNQNCRDLQITFTNGKYDDLQRKGEVFEELFVGFRGSKIARERPDVFGKFLDKATDEDLEFFEKVIIPEFHDLFNPYLASSRGNKEKIDDLMAKIRDFPSFDPADRAPDGKISFSAKNLKMRSLLRRQFLSIMQFYQYVALIDEGKRPEALLHSLFAFITDDADGDNMSAEGDVGYKTLLSNALPALIAHEQGHNISPLGDPSKNNEVLAEFVGDIYAEFFQQALGKDLKYNQIVNDRDEKLRKEFIRQGIEYDQYHIYSRLQKENIEKEFNKKGWKIDWGVMFYALKSMETDYKNNKLSDNLKYFIGNSFDNPNKPIDFGGFIEELLKRYFERTHQPMPGMEISEEKVKTENGMNVIRLFSKFSDQAMQSHLTSEDFIEAWNIATPQERAKMLLKYKNSPWTGHEPYKDPDFLMYVLLDSRYNFRRAVVEINNWGVTDEQKVKNIPLWVITSKLGMWNGAKAVQWLLSHKVLKFRFLYLRVNQHIILDESGFRKHMGKVFSDMMRIFYVNKVGAREPLEAMPVDYLLEHLNRPGISTDEYGPPELTDHVAFDEKTGWANKRLAILIMFIENIVNKTQLESELQTIGQVPSAEEKKGIAYAKTMQQELNLEADHLGPWSEDINQWLADLMARLKSLNIKDRNILGENKEMSFWEAFCMVYVLFKWFDRKRINNPYEWFEDDLVEFRSLIDPSSSVYSILDEIERNFDQVMRSQRADQAMPSGTEVPKRLNRRYFLTLGGTAAAGILLKIKEDREKQLKLRREAETRARDRQKREQKLAKNDELEKNTLEALQKEFSEFKKLLKNSDQIKKKEIFDTLVGRLAKEKSTLFINTRFLMIKALFIHEPRLLLPFLKETLKDDPKAYEILELVLKSGILHGEISSLGHLQVLSRDYYNTNNQTSYWKYPLVRNDYTANAYWMAHRFAAFFMMDHDLHLFDKNSYEKKLTDIFVNSQVVDVLSGGADSDGWIGRTTILDRTSLFDLYTTTYHEIGHVYSNSIYPRLNDQLNKFINQPKNGLEKRQGKVHSARSELVGDLTAVREILAGHKQEVQVENVYQDYLLGLHEHGRINDRENILGLYIQDKSFEQHSLARGFLAWFVNKGLLKTEQDWERLWHVIHDELVHLEQLYVSGQLKDADLEWENFTARIIKGFKDKAMFAQENGGIDLTLANMHLQTQNSDGQIKFHLNPAMLKQLQNAPGFVPVIISIQPMTDVKAFLGLSATT